MTNDEIPDYGDGCTGAFGQRPRMTKEEYVEKWKAMVAGPVAGITTPDKTQEKMPLPSIPQIEFGGPTSWFDAIPEVPEPKPDSENPIVLNRLEIC